MSIEDKFLKYVSYDTQSDEESITTPSTLKQLKLAEALAEECRQMGFDSVVLDEGGVVYALLKGNGLDKEAIGLLAHMDTAMEISGADIKPRIVKNYDGGTIVLNEEYSMNPEQFPILEKVVGDDLIVTDGTTLLGADDKAGIAIIMQTLEEIISSGVPHGDIAVAFTPDEEVGRGVESFDLEKFPVEYAYTVDGGNPAGIDYETFNAASAKIDIQGVSIHPGDAKDKMVNACLAAMEFNALLPEKEIPACTSNREGFYHLVSMDGNVDHARLNYILRDHDKEQFEARKQAILKAAETINATYGPGTATAHVRDQYYNMVEFMKDERPVEKARQALKAAGLEPVSKPVRGGTDGAMLSARGLFTPNLGTGSGNHHGRYEFASIQKMNKMVEVIKNILLEK